MPATRRNPKYLAALAAASLAILVVGFALRPSGRVSESLQVAAPVDTLRLQRLTQRRSIEGLGEFFGEVADQAAPYVLRIQEADRSAILWDPGRAATSGGRRPEPETDALRREPDHAVVGRVRVRGPNIPATLYEVEGGTRLTPLERVAAQLYNDGAWTVAVWRDPTRHLTYASGQFLGSQQRICGEDYRTMIRTNINLVEGMEGGGLFDIEGGLMGLIVRCDDQLAVLEVEDLEGLFESEQNLESRLAARYGMRLTSLSEAAGSLLGAEDGLLVTTIWRGYPAHSGGLRPGDVVTRLDGKSVETLDDFESTLLPVARELFELRVLRWGRRRAVELPARTGQLAAGEVRWSAPHDGVELDQIGPASAVGRAGGVPGDRLLQVNRTRPADTAAASRALNSEGAIYVVLERAGRTWGRLIEQ